MSMSEPTKRTLEHIELIQHDLAPMFEVKLVVVVEGYENEHEGDLTAAGWLFTLCFQMLRFLHQGCLGTHQAFLSLEIFF